MDLCLTTASPLMVANSPGQPCAALVDPPDDAYQASVSDRPAHGVCCIHPCALWGRAHFIFEIGGKLTLYNHLKMPSPGRFAGTDLPLAKNQAVARR